MKKLLMLLAVVAVLAISLPAYGNDGPAKWCECDPQILVYKTSITGKIDDFNSVTCGYEKLKMRGYLVIQVDCNTLAEVACGEYVDAVASHVIYGKDGKYKFWCWFSDGDDITFVPVRDQFAVHYIDDCWLGNAVMNGRFKRTTLCKTRRGACPGCPCYCDVAKSLSGGIKFWDESCEILGWASMKARLDRKWTKKANCCVDPCDGDVPCWEIIYDIIDYLERKGYEEIDCYGCP